MLVTYFFILGKPGKILPTEGQEAQGRGSEEGVAHVQGSLINGDATLLSATEEDEEDEAEEEEAKHPFISSRIETEIREKQDFHLKLFNREELDYWWSHVRYIPQLVVPYMLPLFAVYMAEYMTNQGLYELFIYPGTQLGSIEISKSAQYRV